MIVVHVNLNIVVSKNGGNMNFPFGTDEATSVEELAHVLREKGAVFGWKLSVHPDGQGGHVIHDMVATMIALKGVLMIQDWTRGPVRQVEEG